MGAVLEAEATMCPAVRSSRWSDVGTLGRFGMPRVWPKVPRPGFSCTLSRFSSPAALVPPTAGGRRVRIADGVRGHVDVDLAQPSGAAL